MSDDDSRRIAAGILLDQTARIVGAFAGSVALSPEELTGLIAVVSSALVKASTAEPETKELVPAVPVRKSVTPDFLVCLEDGKKFKMLRRHLRRTYAMTPDEYRRKWNLPWDYPMVAPKYAALRSRIAKGFGFGTASREPAGPAIDLPPSPSRRRTVKLAA